VLTANGLRRFAGALCCTLIFVAACSESGTAPKEQYLARVNDIVISVAEFNAALAEARAGLPADTSLAAARLRALKEEMLHRLLEARILEERAGELKLKISDAELAGAIAAIRQDYPADEFDKMLLERAVSYNRWRRRLKERLLKEKVIQEELMQAVDIQPADIAAYCASHAAELEAAFDGRQNDPDLDRAVLERVRRQKVEADYRTWMAGLMQRYTIDINQALWERILKNE